MSNRKFVAIQDPLRGTWHAARALPGGFGAWASVVECPDEKSAREVCAELDRKEERERRELARSLALQNRADLARRVC